MDHQDFKVGDWICRTSNDECGQIIWVNSHELMIRFDEYREMIPWWHVHERFTIEEAEIPL